jgi:hypothetical protein
MKIKQQLLLNFYEQLVLSFERLSEDEKTDLSQFEKKCPTSQWPGWDKYVDRSA